MPPAETEYVDPLDPQALITLRMRFTKHRGRIVSFLVQYETYEQGKWIAIIRFDTFHGRPHQDIMYASGRKVKVWLEPDLSYNEHMQRAVRIIRTDWARYREEYFRG